MKSTTLLAGLGLLSLAACAVDATPEEAVEQSESGISSGFLSGTRTESGYYQYPARRMGFRTAAGCSFGGGSVWVQAQEVPNRFRVLDGRGNLVASTQWLGTANYAGPWGSSLSSGNPQTATLKVTKPGLYSLVVETMVEKNGTTDAWEASFGTTNINCTNGSSGGTDTTPPACVDKLTATPMGGSFPAGGGYYIYPDMNFTVSYCNTKNISVTANALDVPNRINVYDPSGNLAATTGWFGTSSKAGPWGQSLSTSGTATITFPSKNGTYRLQVETVTSDRNDYWDARVY